VASLLRLMLTPTSWAFAAGAEARYLLYRLGVFTRHRVPCPVVSVGNLTVGGTGKTPLVEWVVRELRLLGLHPVVLSRGYGAAEDEVPDEIATLMKNLPDLRTVRDPDRVRGVLTAIERHCAEVVVLDDGFQHHRLARTLDIVTLDATSPFGGGHCLPRGTLREPVRALRRAGAVVVTRSDQVSPQKLDAILRRLRRLAPRAATGTAVHSPEAVRLLAGGEPRQPATLSGESVYAVSGIGNPCAFEGTLESLGARLVGRARLMDHHTYDEEELARLGREAERAGADLLVTTQKDAVKWGNGPAEGPPSAVLEVRIRFRTGEAAVAEALRAALRVSSGGE